MLYWMMVIICGAGAVVAYFAGKNRAWRTPVLVVCVIGLVGAVMARAVSGSRTYIPKGEPKRPPVAAVESDVACAKALAQAAVSKAGDVGQGKVVVAFPYHHNDQEKDRREKAIVDAVSEATGAEPGRVVGIYFSAERGIYTAETAGAAVVLYMQVFSTEGLESFAVRPLTVAYFPEPKAESSAQGWLKGGLLDVAVLEGGKVLGAP